MFSLARRSDGSFVAWGNDSGQHNAPAPGPGLSYVEVSAGSGFTVALRSDGWVVSWPVFNDVPALPAGVSYVEVAAGGHVAALRSDGSIVAWGTNDHGQCNVPLLPPGLSFVEVATGYQHTVARRSDGSVVAWGRNDAAQCNVPALPPGLTYVEVAAGLAHTAARRSDGSLVAWGLNNWGQCNVPMLPPGLSFVEVATGYGFSVGRRSDGSMVAWGDNYYGQCNVPDLPPGLTYVEVDAGRYHALARRSDGAVLAWGSGELTVPELPPGFRFSQLASGWDHCVALYSVPEPTTYCTAKSNSCGKLPSIESSGIPSASSRSGFLVSASHTRAAKAGLLVYTHAGSGNVPFHGGILCLATTGLKRSAVVVDMTGTPGQCDGTLSIDMNAFAVGSLGGSPSPLLTIPGTRVNVQFWGRDTVPNGALLSNALEYYVSW
jgi:alpha-tubulin suppressor-like RCC1 family protein